MTETVVITRHMALVQHLIETGVVPAGVEVIPHAKVEQFRGKRVVGPLPLHLAAEAASIVSVPLDLPPELRGVELTVEQVRQFAGLPQEFRVTRV